MSRFLHNRFWIIVGGFATVMTALQASWLNSDEPQYAPLQLPSQSQTYPSAQASGKELLDQAHAALNRQDLLQASHIYKQLTLQAKRYPGLQKLTQQLHKELLRQGIHPSNLIPSKNPRPLSKPQQPDPMLANNAVDQRLVSQKLADVRELIAEARFAIDRNDQQTAWNAIQKARRLDVPLSAFQHNETKLWQVEQQFSNLRKRLQRSKGQGTIAHAGGIESSAAPFSAVQHATYEGNPNSHAIRQVQATDQRNFNSRGHAFFDRGMKELTGGNRAQAHESFKEAWNLKDQLDPATRKALQDKLQLMGNLQTQPAEFLKPSAQQLMPVPPQQNDAQRKLQSELQKIFRNVDQQLKDDPLGAEAQLRKLYGRVMNSSVDENSKRHFFNVLDRKLDKVEQYIKRNTSQIEEKRQNQQVRAELAKEASQKASDDRKISDLANLFRQLYEDGQYNEAQKIAEDINKIRPNSEIAAQALTNAKRQIVTIQNRENRAAKENSFLSHMNEIDRLASAPRPDQPYKFADPDSWVDVSNLRLNQLAKRRSLSPAEASIRQKMKTPVKIPNSSFREIIDDWGKETNIPFLIDEPALDNSFDLDTPINFNFRRKITLGSALNLLLENKGLAYKIENEVLTITTQENINRLVIVKSYSVGELVIPIPNFVPNHDSGMTGALRAALQMTAESANVSVMPQSAVGLDLGMRRSGAESGLHGNRDILAQPDKLSGYSTGSLQDYRRHSSGFSGGAASADFDSLIELIKTTVKPDQWDDAGGAGSIKEHQQNLSLVISATSEVHDEISRLLDSLRKLQNLQVSIEVQFITLADSFFEQIGIDFDISIDDNSPGLPDDDSGNSVAVGIGSNTGLLNADLDFKFNNENFPVAPAFGGVPTGSLSNFGIAILSDIEAFFFMQAAQGDTRTNVMQSPKVMVFDGQIASISDTTSKPFVTSIRPVVGDFTVAQQPVILVLKEGTELTVQAVVSNDRRFVRLTMSPFFSQVTNVETFTFTGRSTTTTNTQNNIDPDTGEPTDSDTTSTVFDGTTVQLPEFSFTTVNTTLNVPDGGTVMMGGIKRLREGRTERGVPVLSKIPYVSRLFRNTGIGRDATSLMMMVTPRIIIQEEEEMAQTGFDSSNP